MLYVVMLGNFADLFAIRVEALVVRVRTYLCLCSVQHTKVMDLNISWRFASFKKETVEK